MVIKSLGVVSVARVCAFLSAALGLIGGFFVAAVALLGSALGPEASRPFGGFSGVLGAGAVILFPLASGSVGFLVGLFGAALYNLAAKVFGGVEIETGR
jgi:hypothetical protein